MIKMAVKELNIKNRTYYFYNDLINYIDKNKPKDWCVNSVNPSYLIINKVFCSIGEENGIRYLKIEKNHSEPALNKWNQVFDSIKYHIKKISNEEDNFNDDFNKIKFISDDSYFQL